MLCATCLTLCAQALATSLFASDRALLRFDMAELGADRTSVSRLVGAPPGYVGFGEGGLLTEAVRWVAGVISRHVQGAVRLAALTMCPGGA